MTEKKKTTKPKVSKAKAAKPKKRGRWFKRLFALVVLVCIAGIPLLMHLNARIVTVVYDDVYLKDLPEAFDGMTALFISDIHMMGVNTPEKAIGLMNSLRRLNPDLLLLGGDYTSPTIFEQLQKEDMTDEMTRRRQVFFKALTDFEAPMGKFAVAGNHDAAAGNLPEECRMGGVNLLMNSAAKISRGDAAVYIVGLDDFSSGENRIRELGGTVQSGDCVIVLSHEPDAFPAIAASDAADGGKWADAILAGHMHGGQVNLFGWSPFLPSAHGNRYLTGWIRENGHSMLVSNGVGCSFMNVRWGAPAQAHLITFRKAK